MSSFFMRERGVTGVRALSRTIGIGLLALGGIGFGEGSQISHRVLVVDQAVDFTASMELRLKRDTNAAELSGRGGLDDDGNGFVDDLSGWNIISNSPEHLPEWISDFFRSRRLEIQELSAHVWAKSQGNAESARFLQRADRRKLLMEVGELGHGTHIAGIIAQYSAEKTRILAANIQSASHDLRQNFASAELQHLNTGSIFDDKEKTVAVLRTLAKKSFQQADILTRYMSATRPAVANLSFGSISREEIRIQAEGLWLAHLKRHMLRANSPRNPLQQKNFEFFVNNLFRYEEERWRRLFSQHPETLFVVAAGNRGANLDQEAALPASLSTQFPNVITVLAVDPLGQIAYFSNFGAQSVNVGAWGVDILSRIPGGDQFPMSGTSMAAPFVAALASRIRVAHPHLFASEVRRIIEESVVRVPSLTGRSTTEGVVNFEAALELANQWRRR